MIKLTFNALIDLSFLKDFEQLEDVESSGKQRTEAKKDAKGEPREAQPSDSNEETQSLDSEKEKHKGDETSDSEEKYLTAESSVSGEDKFEEDKFEEDQFEEDQFEEGSLDSEVTGKVSSSPEY